MPNYIGKGWSKKFDNGGTVVNLSINFEKLSALPKDKYGNVRIVAGTLREPDEKSKADYYVAEDEFQTKKLSGDAGF